MQKKFILVGLSNRSVGWEFFKAVLDSLERYSIPVTHTDCVRLRFETEHTKTWFFFGSDRYQYYQGIRPDAVFGSEYGMFRYQLASTTYIAPKKGVGLVEYICQVEREAADEHRRISDLCVSDMYPHTLFTKQALNSIYGKFPKTKRLDPDVFKTEEIEPLSKGKNLDGLRVDFSAIDEWDSYKESVTSRLWPKTNPYLISKEDVEQIIQEGSKQFVDQQLIYALGRGNGKSMMCLKQIEKEFEKKEGEKIMDAVTNDLIMNKNAQLTTAHGTVPVLIDELEIKTCRDTGREVYFEGHMMLPDLATVINRRVDRVMIKPNKLPGIKTVHFSGPVTVVIWEDKTKTVVRANDGEFIDYEKGLAMAIAKKALGTNKSGSNYYDIFKKHLPKPEEDEQNG